MIIHFAMKLTVSMLMPPPEDSALLMSVKNGLRKKRKDTTDTPRAHRHPEATTEARMSQLSA